MSYEPIAADLAVRLTRLQARSARPDAPVVPPRQEPPRRHRTRARTARWLHRLAGIVEPADRPVAARRASAPTGC
jgi:cell pole-organizing protein PopZ